MQAAYGPGSGLRMYVEQAGSRKREERPQVCISEEIVANLYSTPIRAREQKAQGKRQGEDSVLK